MPILYCLDKRLNKKGESAIRLSWSFSGFRYQTTLGIPIEPKFWKAKECRAEEDIPCNSRGTQGKVINKWLDLYTKCSTLLEKEAQQSGEKLSTPLVRKVMQDIKYDSNGEFSKSMYKSWVEDLKADNHHSEKLYVRVGNEDGMKYKMVGYATDYETDARYVLLKESGGEHRTLACSISRYNSDFILARPTT